MLHVKCELIRKLKGRGNHCDYGRGEFIVLNDDTYEVWKRHGESMNKFKKWYKSISNASTAQFIGAYPRYEFIEFN